MAQFNGKQMLTWRDNIIRDGMSQRFYIAEEHNRHGSLSFVARPLLSADIEEIEELIATSSAKKGCGRVVRVVADAIEAWDLDEPVSVRAVSNLRRPVLVKIYEMITSKRSTDVDPSWEDLEPAEEDPDLAALDRIQEQVGK